MGICPRSEQDSRHVWTPPHNKYDGGNTMETTGLEDDGTLIHTLPAPHGMKVFSVEY